MSRIRKYRDLLLVDLPRLIFLIRAEHRQQLHKWGVQNRTLFEWLAYLVEEVGELSRAISENHYRNGSMGEIKKESIQVATLALKIAEIVHNCSGDEDAI